MTEASPAPHTRCRVDNDDKGRAHGRQVAADLYPLATSVKVIELPSLPEKGDVEELLRLVAQAPAWTPDGQPSQDDRDAESPPDGPAFANYRVEVEEVGGRKVEVRVGLAAAPWPSG